MNSSRFVALLLACCPSAVFAALPPLDSTARASYLWTENIGRASGASDFRNAESYEADFAIGTTRQFASGLSGRVQLEAGASLTPDYDLLNEKTFGPRGILRKKFGLGAQAPVLAIEAATIGRLARIDENDGVTLQGAVTLSKRFTPQFAAQVRGEWQEHVAESTTYDVHHYGISGRLDFDPFERLRVSVGAGRLDGTFTAGASAARFGGALAGSLGPDVASYYARVPQTVTDTFQPGWVTYRVEGRVDNVWVELAPAINDALSLFVRYERNHAVNRVDVGYRQDIFGAGFVYTF